MKKENNYKNIYTLQERKNEYEKIILKFPMRIPIILENNSTSNNNIPDIDKKKFLLPYDMTISQFLIILRKRIKISPTSAIYIFIENIIPSGPSIISDLYKSYKDEDGFLYMSYRGENTFGLYLLPLDHAALEETV
jgi:GABA(A) receptor-associated protein